MGIVTAAAGTQATAPIVDRPPPPPPPPPPLTPVQQGDIAAGRLRPVDGQLYTVDPQGRPNNAPPTADWGRQGAGSSYRQTFDSVSARLGTTDPVRVSAEIDRQLYPSNATPPPAATAPSQEGVGSFVEGAVLGNFSDNHSWSATGGQVAVGFVPVLGQIADARDTIASIGQVMRGESGGWLNLGASVVGWVPGVGDAAKAAIRGGSNAVEASADVARTAVRQADALPPPATVTGANAVQPAASTNPALTFRADSRPPSEIFANGFQPRGSSTDVIAHALDSANPPSAFVPTSRSADVARQFARDGGHDNIYVVRPTNGIDVNRTLGAASPYPHELEVAAPGIAPSDVRGLTLEQQGISILNPGWHP